MDQTVGIIGASGWIGKHLIQALLAKGDRVVGYSRSARNNDDIEWRRWDGSGKINLSGLDAVVNLAGEAIDQRWTDTRKKLFYESRVTLTKNLVSSFSDSSVKVLLNGSAVGIYGDRDDTALDESSSPGFGYLADLCVSWEKAATPAAAMGIRVCHLRTGVVLGKGGRAWDKMAKVFRLGVGGKLGGGRQWMPWIHLDDEIAGIVHCLKNEISGPVNLVAPESVTNAQFTKAISDALSRPSIFTAPAFMLQLILGDFAKEGLLASQCVVPRRLQKDGFTFRFPDIHAALEELTGD